MSHLRNQAFALSKRDLETLMHVNDGQLILMCEPRITIYQHQVRPGFGVPVHVHDDLEEVCFVVSEEVRIQIENQTVDLASGAVISLGSGVAHAYVGLGTEPSVLRWVAIPGGYEDLFAQIEDLPAGTSGARVVAMNKIAEKYKTRFFGAVPDA